MKNELINRIDAYLKENKQEIVDILLDLIRIPSVRGEAVENAPYGKHCFDMVNAVAELMDKNSFKTVNRNDLGYTYSLFQSNSNKTIGIYAHGDVVPAVGEWLICPPFEPIIKDGFIFGRGCNDDKSGIVQMLYAAKIIRDFNIPFKSNILMFTGVNEETGMGDIASFTENENLPDVGLVLDGGSYPCDIGERSIIRFELISKSRFLNIKEFFGAENSSYNIILPEATAVLEYNEECFKQLMQLTDNDKSFEINCCDKNLYIKAIGKAAHTTEPESGINAGRLIAELLLKCDFICENDKNILSDTLKLLSDGYGKEFGIDINNKNFGLLTYGNGIIKTADQRLCLNFDMRFDTALDFENVSNKIIERVNVNWEYNELRASEGYFVDSENRYRKALCKWYKAVMGEEAEIGGEVMLGATHARYLKNSFPITNQNKLIIPEYPMPKGHGSYHQPDEKLYVDAFIDAIKILVFLLMGLDEEINK